MGRIQTARLIVATDIPEVNLRSQQADGWAQPLQIRSGKKFRHSQYHLPRLLHLDVGLRLIQVTPRVRHTKPHKKARVSRCHLPVNLPNEVKSFRELVAQLQRRNCQSRYNLGGLAHWPRGFPSPLNDHCVLHGCSESLRPACFRILI